ncbi:uncharacterized protein TNCV_2045251 [Trichonephila clavipes]|uniref:Uncharacterized protein n=1 Tax=Trichonephila clavipes TaxID=2585209 RepID=A0A8X6SRB0_TRICX|nr:uncharacterized protein TNCV_2045251 [Trichonephila clavipes]
MVMNEAGIAVGKQSFNYAEQMDNPRVSRQNRRSSLESKEGRKALLQAQNEVYEEEELLGVATAVSMIRGPQATGAPTCVTSPNNRALISKKGPRRNFDTGPPQSAYASVHILHFPSCPSYLR